MTGRPWDIFGGSDASGPAPAGSSSAFPGYSVALRSLGISDGRLHIRPFQVRTGGLGLTVAGSNGVDQSLDYQLTLKVPRALLGSGADQGGAPPRC